MIRAAAENNREALYVQLAQGEGEFEEVTLTNDNTSDIGAGLVLNSANSPGMVFIDGGGLTVKLSSATPEKHSTPLITVGQDVTLTLRNITFTGLTAEKNYASSLIKVESGGTLILEDGAGIKNAVRAWFADIPGAGGVTVFGTLIMNGGEISGNGTTTSNNHGGGVYVGAGGEFTMKGGTISNNTIAASSGGGVYVTGGTFTMENGTISGNTAYYGGGVFVENASTFTMEGGTVKDNHTNSAGGGVVVYNSAFKKTGGTIYGDDAEGGVNDPATGKPLKNTSGDAYGHAVYAENSGSAPLERKRNSTAGSGVTMYFSFPEEEDSGWEE